MMPDYKRILAGGIGLVMLAAAVAPAAVLAVQEQNREQNAGTAEKNLCETLSTSASKVNLRLDEKADKLWQRALVCG